MFFVGRSELSEPAVMPYKTVTQNSLFVPNELYAFRRIAIGRSEKAS